MGLWDYIEAYDRFMSRRNHVRFIEFSKSNLIISWLDQNLINTIALVHRTHRKGNLIERVAQNYATVVVSLTVKLYYQLLIIPAHKNFCAAEIGAFNGRMKFIAWQVIFREVQVAFSVDFSEF